MLLLSFHARLLVIYKKLYMIRVALKVLKQCLNILYITSMTSLFCVFYNKTAYYVQFKLYLIICKLHFKVSSIYIFIYKNRFLLAISIATKSYYKIILMLRSSIFFIWFSYRCRNALL